MEARAVALILLTGCFAFDAQKSAPDADLPVDGPVTSDSGMDAPPAACPTSYTLRIGQHAYRVVQTSKSWVDAAGACAVDSSSAYLATPDDANELESLTNAAGGNVSAYWVGISDRTAEGIFRNMSDMLQSYLPWLVNEPDNLGEQDCVSAQNNGLRTDSCASALKFVCECVGM